MENVYDVVIIGVGPAGVSAALYAHRAGAKILVIGQNTSALIKAEKIDNYYGVEKSTTGKELFEMGINQLKSSNIDMIFSQVTSLEWSGDFTVKTTQSTYTSKSVVLATGASRKTPPIKGLKELEGRGVSYCAVCDGFFYKGKDVAVIGEGEYAAEEAGYIKNLANKVYVLTNGKKPEKKVDSVEYIEKEIESIQGQNVVEEVKFKDDTNIKVNGVFVAVGVAGSSDFAKKLGIELDINAIVVDDKCATSIPGLYAAGDNTKGIYQVSKAVYQGAIAGSESAKYVKKMKG